MNEVKKRKTADLQREQAKTAAARRKKRRRKRSYFLYYLMLFLFIAIVGCVLSVTVFFNIQTIHVEGSTKYNADEVIQAGEVAQGDNLFRINTGKIASLIRNKLVYVDSVKVIRDFPDALSVQITEAAPYASIQNESGTYTVLSAGGRVLETASPQKAENTIEVTGITLQKYEQGDFISDEQNENYAALVQIYQNCTELGLNQITRLEFRSQIDIRVFYGDRIRIDLGSISDLNYKLTFAREIITNRLGEEEKGVIDAKQSGTIYFRPTEDLLDSSQDSETESEPAADSSTADSSSTASESASQENSQA